MRHRLEVYNANTRPLLDYYGNAGILSRVDGVGSAKQVEERMIEALDGLLPANAGKSK